MFKGYLIGISFQRESHQLQSKATIEKQATKFKYKGNRKQFKLNAEVDEIIKRIVIWQATRTRYNNLQPKQKMIVK